MIPTIILTVLHRTGQNKKFMDYLKLFLSDIMKLDEEVQEVIFEMRDEIIAEGL